MPLIAPLKINLKALNNARRNLQANIELNISDRRALLQLMSDGPGTTFHYLDMAALVDEQRVFKKVDRQILLDIIHVSEGDIYPSQMTLNRHEYHLSQIEKLCPVKDANQYEMISEQILEFLNKYCR